jgi:hypothetical protein
MVAADSTRQLGRTRQTLETKYMGLKQKMEASGKNHKTQSKGMIQEHVKLLDDLNELRRVQHKLDLEYRS